MIEAIQSINNDNPIRHRLLGLAPERKRVFGRETVDQVRLKQTLGKLFTEHVAVVDAYEFTQDLALPYQLGAPKSKNEHIAQYLQPHYPRHSFKEYWRPETLAQDLESRDKDTDGTTGTTPTEKHQWMLNLNRRATIQYLLQRAVEVERYGQIIEAGTPLSDRDIAVQRTSPA